VSPAANDGLSTLGVFTALLGWNSYLFADLPGDHSFLHLNLALWVTFILVAGYHSTTARQVAARVLAPGTTGS
jgi:ABC-type glycerol-3-phosphate transport system permease component